MNSSPRPVLPIRFDDPAIHALLKAMADRLGVTMNQMVQEMIARELPTYGLGLEADLADTLALLRSYRGQGRQEAWLDFAAAENEQDPIKARRADVADDPYGIARAFAAPAGDGVRG